MIHSGDTIIDSIPLHIVWFRTDDTTSNQTGTLINLPLWDIAWKHRFIDWCKAHDIYTDGHIIEIKDESCKTMIMLWSENI